MPSRTRLHPACRKYEAISACRRKALAGRSNDSITEDETSQWGTTDTSFVSPKILTSQVSAREPRRKIHRRVPADSAGFRVETARFMDVVMAGHRATLMPRFPACLGQKGIGSQPFFRACRAFSPIFVTFSRPYVVSLTLAAAIPDDVASGTVK